MKKVFAFLAFLIVLTVCTVVDAKAGTTGISQTDPASSASLNHYR